MGKTLMRFIRGIFCLMRQEPMESSVNPPRLFYRPLTAEEEVEVFEIPQEILDKL